MTLLNASAVIEARREVLDTLHLFATSTRRLMKVRETWGLPPSSKLQKDLEDTERRIAEMEKPATPSICITDIWEARARREANTLS